MELFISTLEQMVFLFAFIIIGYTVTKLGAVPKTAAGILSKLENNIFIQNLMSTNQYINLARCQILGYLAGLLGCL